MLLCNDIPIVINTNNTNQLMMVKRTPTSINVNPELWKEVKKASIDMGITVTEFFELALQEKLKKEKLE